MSGITLKPILGCNFSCTGCYEGEIFKRNNNSPEPYDIPAIIEAIKVGPGGPVALHGGEITLMPVSDMRLICEAVRELGRPLVMQTNGAAMTKKLFELIEEFKISVGVSINGPDVMNRDRRVLNAKQIDITDKMTDRIHANIRRMLEAGVSASIITVLSTTNAGSPELVERLAQWAMQWEREGLRWIRFNPLNQDGEDCISGEVSTELTNDQLSHAWTTLADYCFDHPNRMWGPFREMVDNHWGLGLQPCWWSQCDVYNTDAVYAVLHDGSVGNCLRTAKDGIPYQRAMGVDHTRQTILQQIPMAEGGCGGCRYWDVCHGGCPAEGLGSDWRNKTRFCEATINLNAHVEGKLTGLMPNFTSRVAWTTNDKVDLQQRVSSGGAADITPVNPMLVAWSQRPSTFEPNARYPR